MQLVRREPRAVVSMPIYVKNLLVVVALMNSATTRTLALSSQNHVDADAFLQDDNSTVGGSEISFNPHGAFNPGAVGPKSLAAYCAQSRTSDKGYGAGQPVQANWLGLGKYHPAWVRRKNSDGTYNIRYEDGRMLERGVTEDMIKPRRVGPQDYDATKEDPACRVERMVRKLEKNLAIANRELGKWLKSHRGRHWIGVRTDGLDAPAPQPAPAGALRGFQHLRDGSRRNRIKELRDAPAPSPGSPSGPSPMWPAVPAPAELLAIAAKKESGNNDDDDDSEEDDGDDEEEEDDKDEAEKEIQKKKEEELRKQAVQEAEKRKEQDSESDDDDDDSDDEEEEDDDDDEDDGSKLAYPRDMIDAGVTQFYPKSGSGPKMLPASMTITGPDAKQGSGDLPQVVSCMYDMELQFELIDTEINDLGTQGILDVELETAAKGALGKKQDIILQVKALQTAMDDVNKIDKMIRDKPASRRRRQKLPKLSTLSLAKSDPGSSDELANQAAKALEEEVVRVAVSMQKVDQKVDALESDVHPHGLKWWRFRYEYSYVESLVMLIVTPVMILWKCVYDYFAKFEERDVTSARNHRASWLHFAAGDILVALLVVITVWIASSFNLFYLLVSGIQNTDTRMHMPSTPVQYVAMAMTIALQLGSSLLLYHCLGLGMSMETSSKMEKWKAFSKEEMKLTPGGSLRDSFSTRLSRMESWISPLNFCGTPEEFRLMKEWFVDAVENHPASKKRLEEIAPIDWNFPFYEYLTVNVKIQTEGFFQLKAFFWFAVFLTFGCFTILHRVFQLAYIRIMTFFCILMAVTILCMVLCVNYSSKNLEAWMNKSVKASQPSFALRLARKVLIYAFQFCLFFLCYGFVRMVTAPWLWVVYFWNVLWLSVTFIAMMLILVFVLAPLIPTYSAVMCIPPQVTDEEMKAAVDILKTHTARSRHKSNP